MSRTTCRQISCIFDTQKLWQYSGKICIHVHNETCPSILKTKVCFKVCAFICPLCSNWMVGGWVRINSNVVRIVKSSQNNGRSLINLLFLMAGLVGFCLILKKKHVYWHIYCEPGTFGLHANFWAHLCTLHGGLICITFRLSVCLSEICMKFRISKKIMRPYVTLLNILPEIAHMQIWRGAHCQRQVAFLIFCINNTHNTIFIWGSIVETLDFR